MKKRTPFYYYFALLSALLLFPAVTTAQEASFHGQISGHIQDENKAPLPYLTVRLKSAKDSTLVKAISADSTGHFTFKTLPQGHYYVNVQLIGFKAASSQEFHLNPSQPQVNLGAITLHSSAESLSAVKVTTTQPLVEHKPGKTVVNVENSSLSAGNTLMGLLRKSPGVFVDQNDNISLNGQGGVMVMINGRPTHLSGTQLAAFLKNVPAASVAKIELMTQPPARYSAEGTAGIINIVMKKEVATGWNGSLNLGAGYGQYWNYNGGASVNYGGEKLSFYASYNYKHQKREFNMNMMRDFYDANGDLKSSMQQSSLMKFKSDNHTAQIGLDYDINDNHSIGFVVNGSFNDRVFNSHSPIYFMNATGHVDSISTSNNQMKGTWENEQANLHYNIDLDKKGSALTLNLDYSHFQQDGPQVITSTTTDGNGNQIGDPLKRKGEQPTDINIYAAKLDYTQVLKNNFKLAAGVKTSFVKTDNNSLFKINESGTWHNDPNNTNHFLYEENINAGYASLNKTFKNGWSAKVGVRAEQVNIKTDQVTTDSINEQHYLDFFPNITLSKEFNSNHVLSLAYSRRINRPSYQSLNPFVYYVDEYTYRSGNPYLLPEYTDKLALSYTYKRRYSAVLSYSHTNDVMSRIVTQDPVTHIVTTSRGNISEKNNIRLNLSVPVKITSWWRTFNSAQIYYNHYQGIYSGFALDKGFTSFMLNTYQSFMIAPSLTANLTAMYRGATIMGPFKVDPMGMVSVGLKKSLWDGKASVKLNVQDIFQSLNFTSSTDFGNLHMNNNFQINARSVNLSFTWNFGNQKVKVRKHEESSIENQESRIQKSQGNSQGL